MQYIILGVDSIFIIVWTFQAILEEMFLIAAGKIESDNTDQVTLVR